MKAASGLADRLATRALASQESPKSATRWMRLSTALTPSGIRSFQLAEMLLQQGRAIEARRAMNRSISTFTGTPPVEVRLTAGLIECAAKDMAAAERHLRACLAAYPDHQMTAYVLGSVLCSQGKLTEADVLFARDAPVMTGTGRVTYSRALCFGEAPGAARPVHIAPLDPAAPLEKAVFFAAADSVYFCRYARQVANSLARFAGFGLHLHIVNPSSEAMALANELSRSPAVTVSTETIDPDTFDEDQLKTYFSCARYLVLPDLMGAHSAPIVVMDMDQLVMSDPAPLLKFASPHDVCMLRFDSAVSNMFSFFSATLLVVSPTEKGRQFARQLQSNLAYAVISPGQMLWHVDQAALVKTHFSLPSVDYGFIPLKMLHLGGGEPAAKRPANEGMFWSITNSVTSNMSKLDLPSFRQFG